MIEYNRDRARRAVQFLVDTPYFPHHCKRIRSTATRPRALPFRGEAEPLNELVIIGRQNAAALENLLEVAESKRSDRNDYQRIFMANKRRRDRKVIQLEELMTGSKLRAPERMDTLRRQYLVWNRERDRMLKALPDSLTYLQRNAHIHDFWQAREAELDEPIVEALRTGPVRRKPARRVVHVSPPPPPPGTLGDKLARALQDVDKRR